MRLVQPESGLLAATAGAEEAARVYLGLDHEISKIHESFPRGREDAILREAMAYCPGLRILNQPSWECLATFITSSLKQVAHISQISHELRQRFGERLEIDGNAIYAYPLPQAIADAGEDALRACGLGYRARGLHRAALRLARGEVDLDALRELPDDELREALCGFYGVGEKIADCVSLFGFGRLQSFPVDVWIERLLRKHYGGQIGEKAPLPRVREFAQAHFGRYGGYAQQYLFHYARLEGV